MNAVTTSQLADQIRQRRKELGWTQAKLADETRVSRDWIVQLEKGKPSAEIALVLRTIKALGMVMSVNVKPDYGDNTNPVDYILAELS